ncbi:MAG: hypothetical protein WC440_06330 [Candidatus Omnitrophota bacterium]
MDWLVPEQDVRRPERARFVLLDKTSESVGRVAERDFSRWEKSRVPARNKTSQPLK